MGDLRELTAQAHKLGMKVVLDIVVNHMGQVFFYDMNLNGVPDRERLRHRHYVTRPARE